MEVLFAETTELFAWPGSSEFTSEPLQNWIGAGAIGNVDFVTEILNLFVISAATVKYSGVSIAVKRISPLPMTAYAWASASGCFRPAAN